MTDRATIINKLKRGIMTRREESSTILLYDSKRFLEFINELFSDYCSKEYQILDPAIIIPLRLLSRAPHETPLIMHYQINATIDPKMKLDDTSPAISLEEMVKIIYEHKKEVTQTEKEQKTIILAEISQKDLHLEDKKSLGVSLRKIFTAALIPILISYSRYTKNFFFLGAALAIKAQQIKKYSLTWDELEIFFKKNSEEISSHIETPLFPKEKPEKIEDFICGYAAWRNYPSSLYQIINDTTTDITALPKLIRTKRGRSPHLSIPPGLVPLHPWRHYTDRDSLSTFYPPSDSSSFFNLRRQQSSLFKDSCSSLDSVGIVDPELPPDYGDDLSLGEAEEIMRDDGSSPTFK